MRTAQAAIEYIILIGILLVFLIPIIYYALNESTTSIRANQLDNSLRRIAKAVNTVYALGPGAQEIVTITLPTGIETSVVNGASIFMNATIYGGVTDIHYPTVATAVGSLPTQPGTYRIRVTTFDNDTVGVSLR